MSKAQAQQKKADGNGFFKNKDYEKAIAKYTEAIDLDGSDVTFWSNRSACYAALDMWQEAANDGRECIMKDKNFVKGYFRAALAQQNLGDLKAAQDAVKRGLGIDSTNADLKKMSKAIDELNRQKTVEDKMNIVEDLFSKKDYAGAYKQLDAALRLDPENKALNTMMNKVRPKYEMSEKERYSNLDPKERIKEKGDEAFKAANFESAIVQYTSCLDKISDKSHELALKCYGNRAACYKQLSNFDGTIGDCTAVLEYKPEDVKALVRRAQAFEACERYKSALQDVRQVLSYGPEKAGKASFDLCNGMQHRLNRVIEQLKRG